MQISLRVLFAMTTVAAVAAFAFQFALHFAFGVFLLFLPVILTIVIHSENKLTDENAIWMLFGLTLKTCFLFLVIAAWFEPLTLSKFVGRVFVYAFLAPLISLFVMPYNLAAFAAFRVLQTYFGNVPVDS